MDNDSALRLPFSMLGGFLGSDKASLLNHLVRDAGLKRTPVLINEFGKIGLDHQLVAHSKDENDVVIESAATCPERLMPRAESTDAPMSGVFKWPCG